MKIGNVLTFFINIDTLTNMKAMISPKTILTNMHGHECFHFYGPGVV